MTATPTVTPRQLEIMKYIRDVRARLGYSPTMQEIGDHLQLTKVTVFEHVVALEKKGLLHRGPKHSARSLQLSPEFIFHDEGQPRLKLLGRIAAGSPIEAIENPDSLDLEKMFAPDQNTFALVVAGQSMIDDQITDGDFIVCRRADQPRNGQMVVATLSDGQATLKRFYHEKGRIRLQPSNPAYQPIYVKDVDIQGVVVGVVRKI